MGTVNTFTPLLGKSDQYWGTVPSALRKPDCFLLSHGLKKDESLLWTNSLQHFANDGQKCDWAVVTGVGHAAFLVNWNYKAGLEKSAAIRPFATKKSRLASEKILLADSLATESCRLADRLATKLFFQSGQRRCRTQRDRARCVAVFVGPRCKGVGRSGPVDRVCK